MLHHVDSLVTVTLNWVLHSVKSPSSSYNYFSLPLTWLKPSPWSGCALERVRGDIPDTILVHNLQQQ